MGGIGVICLLIVIVMEIAYPNPMFSIISALGLFLVFAGATLILIAYFKLAKKSICKKDYITIILLLFSMIIFLGKLF